MQCQINKSINSKKCSIMNQELKEKFEELEVTVLAYCTIMGYNDEESEELYNAIFDSFEELEELNNELQRKKVF